ncbi:PIN domain-containing protein [Roseateles sp. BYS87W]|uniref:Toxin-antitoxin system toxin component, PIN family n=1 Tax=Pelomonas baiyunensis TaxID=3299026 RepID=A0ABW7H279_9BURK
MDPTAPAVAPSLPVPADERPQLVIDTQVVMDWLVFRDPRVERLTHALTAGSLRWLVAPAMLDELWHVLGRGVAAAYGPDRAHIESQFAAHALWVDNPPPQALAGRLVCRDPDDQKFIDLAVAHRVRWLISRDKAVLALAKRARAIGIQIVTPDRWAAE